MSAPEVRFASLPQGRIAYRESGDGDPLLFVHGWPVSSLTWRKVIPALEPSHAIYHAAELARRLSPEQLILVCLSGRGDKDIHIVAEASGIQL